MWRDRRNLADPLAAGAGARHSLSLACSRAALFDRPGRPVPGCDTGAVPRSDDRHLVRGHRLRQGDHQGTRGSGSRAQCRTYDLVPTWLSKAAVLLTLAAIQTCRHGRDRLRPSPARRACLDDPARWSVWWCSPAGSPWDWGLRSQRRWEPMTRPRASSLSPFLPQLLFAGALVPIATMGKVGEIVSRRYVRAMGVRGRRKRPGHERAYRRGRPLLALQPLRRRASSS